MSRRRPFTRPVALAATLATLALAAGCGAKHETLGAPPAQSLSLLLDYLPNADHAGIYTAKVEGDFRAAGLDVSIRTPSDPAEPLRLLAAGRVDLAVSYEPELMLARDRGAQLVAVGALVQEPLTSLISLPGSRVQRPADLANARLGTAGIPYQHAELTTILGRAHVAPSAVHEVNVGFNLVPAMLSKQVDATLGAYWNVEAVQLAAQHHPPRVIRVDQAGVPTYDELVVVARRDELATRGALIRRFMQALSWGYASERQSPDRATHDLLAAAPGAGEPAIVADQVRTTVPALFPTDPARPFGYQDPGAWSAFADWMAQNHLVSHRERLGNAETDEFLPGQGV